ncbi:MAG: myo-inosose-2 dehydratase [Alphaproteobacteria bacterium]|nr:myo-inosose-2 dehydratase [Alphaproteobacteria bacterium]
MAVRLGINPIGWSNDDDPALGGDIPLETCLAQARAAGFDGVELGNKFPHQAGALRAVLDAHDLVLASGWYSAELRHRDAVDEIAAMAAHRDLLLAMGCDVMVFAETSGTVHGQRDRPLSSRPQLSDDDWPEFAERLTVVADHLADQGLRMAYHHHMGTVIETAEEIDRLMASTGPSVGLLLDTGHITYAGADPAALARKHIDRIVHVHCKDIRADRLDAARAGDSSFLDAVVAGVFTVPGDGSVDYPAFLAVLADADYRGWLVVEAEQDPAKAPPAEYARMGHENLDLLAAEAGL